MRIACGIMLARWQYSPGALYVFVNKEYFVMVQWQGNACISYASRRPLSLEQPQSTATYCVTTVPLRLLTDVCYQQKLITLPSVQACAAINYSAQVPVHCLTVRGLPRAPPPKSTCEPQLQVVKVEYSYSAATGTDVALDVLWLEQNGRRANGQQQA